MPSPEERRQAKLSTVRALLAKATRTEFSEEARLLTSKAQELMTRYALTEAQLEAHGERERDQIVTVVVEVEAPYRSGKGLLLGAIADANGCEMVAVHEGGTTWYHLTGFTSDADRVQLLFTSLLLQAAREMLAATAEPWVNLRSFRHAFLVGYATEIGGRLRASSETALADHRHAHGSDILPVLVDRQAQVRHEVERQWQGRLRSSRITYRTGTGFSAGRRAARRAEVVDRRLRARRALRS